MENGPRRFPRIETSIASRLFFETDKVEGRDKMSWMILFPNNAQEAAKNTFATKVNTKTFKTKTFK